MKFRVTFKTPDALDEAAVSFAENEVQSRSETYGINLGEIDSDVLETTKLGWYEDAMKLAKKWVKWDEYITVEFDLENKTVKVLEV